MHIYALVNVKVSNLIIYYEIIDILFMHITLDSFYRNEWKQKHHLTSALEENNGQANGNVRADDEEGAELKLLDSENNSKNVE